MISFTRSLRTGKNKSKLGQNSGYLWWDMGRLEKGHGRTYWGDRNIL